MSIKPMRLPLSTRISLYITSILALSITALVYYDHYSHTRLISTMGMNEAERLSGIVFDNLFISMSQGGGRKGNRVVVDRFRAVQGVEDIRLVHGPAVDRQFGTEPDEFALDDYELEALKGRASGFVEPSGVIARFVRPVFFKENCLRCHKTSIGEVAGVVNVRINLESYHSIISQTTNQFLSISAVVLLFMIFATLTTVRRRFIVPLFRLKAAVLSLAVGDLEKRVDIKTGDEFEELAAAFNSMADSILETTSRLRTLGAKHFRLVEMAPDAMLIQDPISRVFLDANPAALVLTGDSSEVLRGMHIEHLMPCETRMKWLAALNQWVSEGRGQLSDTTIMRKDGRVAPVDVSASIVELDEGKVLQHIWRDISERKRLEAVVMEYTEGLELKVDERTLELSRSHARLEEAYKRLQDSEHMLIQSAKMASLGEMGAGIAHELNSPLAGILSITEVLLKRTSQDSQSFPFLEKIKDAAVRSKYIIQDLLTFASPFTGKTSPLFINETVRSAMNLFLAEIKKGEINIKEELEDGIPKVMGNKGQLVEVILNIVKNAKDALREKGEKEGVVIIRTRSMDNQKTVAIEIADNGVGIPGHIRDKIFDPFFTTKEKGGGINIGLGLSICDGIIKKHDGRIEVESEKDKGTVFRVLLPALKECDYGA
ncbi:MAG: PAS domain S-box protein [Deltaproteobacteria bacterium]|nr:PAS domain S-box protein [Deltaproteobacteria bacterium]